MTSTSIDPIAQCVHCYEFYNPNHSVGTWLCRMHPAPRTLDPRNPSTTYLPCCGLTSTDEKAAIRGHYARLRQDDIRGCLRVDHMSLAEALARHNIAKSELKARPRFLDDVGIIPVDDDDDAADGMRFTPLNEAVLTQQKISLEELLNPAVYFAARVDVAWPPGAHAEKDFRTNLETFVRDTYADPAYQKKMLSKTYRKTQLLSRMGKPIHPTNQPGKKQSMTPAQLEEYEALYGADAAELDKASFLARLITYQRADLQVGYKLIRRVAPKCDEGTLGRVRDLKASVTEVSDLK